MNMTQPQVFTMNPLEDVFPDTPSNGRASYALHMARGEGEGFLVAIRAGDAPLAGLSARVRCDAPGVEWGRLARGPGSLLEKHHPYRLPLDSGRRSRRPARILS